MTHDGETVALTSQPRRWFIGAWYGVVVMAAATVLSAVNNIIINLMIDPIKASVGLNDTEIGALTGLALTLMAGIAAFPMGWLADRVERRFLMAVCVGCWTVATVGFGLSETFAAMMAWAVFMSISEAVLGPMTYSMIPDLFPRRLWVAANYVFYLSAIFGVSIGFSVSAGLIAWVETHAALLPFGLETLETWRGALIVSTVTGPILMLAILFIPLRKRAFVEKAASSTAGMLDFMRRHARALGGVFFGFGIAYAALGTSRAWLAPTLTRDFGESPAAVGATLGWTSALAAFIGVAAGWLLTKALRPRLGDNTVMRVAQIGLMGALVATVAALFATNAVQLYAAASASLSCYTVAMSLSPAILQFLSPAGFRARLIAIGGAVTIVAGSVSPILVGVLSDQVFGSEGRLLWSVTSVAVPALVIGLACMNHGATAVPAAISEAKSQA